MTVSSVKNLNGETFSAVQDASLTDIVSSNSANWNEISAYQANSANYLQNTDLTITDGKVTEISGVPLSAGDEFPQSATDAIGYITATSGDINSTIDNVSANSGVWGGSALPISAGPGITFEMLNDILIVSTDETVLFESTDADGTTLTTANPITLAEDYSNFKRMRIEYRIWTDQSFKFILEEVPCRNGYFTLSHGYINAPLNPSFYEFLYGLSGHDSKLYYSFGRYNAMGQTGLTTVNELNIMGVTGIGRKN